MPDGRRLGDLAWLLVPACFACRKENWPAISLTCLQGHKAAATLKHLVSCNSQLKVRGCVGVSEVCVNPSSHHLLITHPCFYHSGGGKSPAQPQASDMEINSLAGVACALFDTCAVSLHVACVQKQDDQEEPQAGNRIFIWLAEQEGKPSENQTANGWTRGACETDRCRSQLGARRRSIFGMGSSSFSTQATRATAANPTSTPQVRISIILVPVIILRTRKSSARIVK